MEGIEQLLIGYWDKLPLLIAFLGGLIAFLAPCTFPLLPVFFSHISGAGFIEVNKGVDNKLRFKILVNTLLFVLGFTSIFVLMAFVVMYFSNFASKYIYSGFVYKILGTIVIIMGLHMTGIFKLNFLQYEKKVNVNFKGGKYLSSLFVGMAFALGWSPCSGPILGTVLAFAASAETAVMGVMLLVMFSLGLGLPFIIFGFFIEVLVKFIAKMNMHLRKVEIISGVILIIMGILLFTDSLSLISNWLQG